MHRLHLHHALFNPYCLCIDRSFNPFPALATSCDIHGKELPFCQKDTTGHPCQILTLHAISKEAKFYTTTFLIGLKLPAFKNLSEVAALAVQILWQGTD